MSPMVDGIDPVCGGQEYEHGVSCFMMRVELRQTFLLHELTNTLLSRYKARSSVSLPMLSGIVAGTGQVDRERDRKYTKFSNTGG